MLPSLSQKEFIKQYMDSSYNPCRLKFKELICHNSEICNDNYVIEIYNGVFSETTMIYTILDNFKKEVSIFNDSTELLIELENMWHAEISKCFLKKPLIEKTLKLLSSLEIKRLSRINVNDSVKINVIKMKNQKFATEIDNSQHNLKNLILKLNDINTIKNIKNYGMTFQSLNIMFTRKLESEDSLAEETSYVEYSAFEKFDDKINEIILVQKTKRFIQKTFSEKYRYLLNNDTFNLIKELVMKNISVKDFHDNFANKIARYKNELEFNKDLKSYIQQSQGWSIKSYLKKAESLGIDIVYNENNRLTLKIDTYKQSQVIGSKQWCISYDERFFHNYHQKGPMFFVYNFNKDIDDNTSIIGVVLNEGGIYASHWKNDEHADIENSYFSSAIPNIKDIDFNEYRWDYLSKIHDPLIRNDEILSCFSDINDFEYINQALFSGLIIEIDTVYFRKWIEYSNVRINHNSHKNNQWKRIVENVVSNKFSYLKDEILKNMSNIQQIIEANNPSLVRNVFNIIKGDNHSIQFESNPFILEIIIGSFPRNSSNRNFILELLQQHNFNLNKSDFKKIEGNFPICQIVDEYGFFKEKLLINS
jgi:hypothetical protein